MNEKWAEIKKKYWPPKKDQLLIIVLLGLLLAVIAIPVEKKQVKSENVSETAATDTEEPDYESRMEQRLE